MTAGLREKAASVDGQSSRFVNNRIAGFFALLFVIEWFLYFRHAGHFFQGDSVFLLYYRMKSFGGVLMQFFRLHASGWYRPLANDVFEYALYPFSGLNPIAYRIPVYGFFIADTIAAYALIRAISRRELAACIGTFFFAVHSVGGFVTFDLGFLPDLMSTFFYLVAVLTYLRFLENGTKSAFWLSLASFAGSLMSKETCVTLPGVLVVLYVLMSRKPESFGARIVAAFKSCAAHIVILCVYLAFAVAYLNVQNVLNITTIAAPQRVESGGYNLVFGATILTNADLAMTWALNIPRGYMGSSRHLTPAMLVFLKAFRAMLAGLTLVLLIGRERNKVLFGLAWFFLTLIPSLPLLDHLLPNYLFLPLAGLSIIVGMAFALFYEALRRFQPAVSAAVVIGIFAALLYVCNYGIQNDILESRLLGASADIAHTSLTDLQRMYPTLPPKMTLFFEDREEPLSWEHTSGGLLKMAYNTPDVSALYESSGDALPSDQTAVNQTILLRFGRDRRLVDETSLLRANPLGYLIQYQDSSVNKLSLSKSEAVIGDSYKLSVTGLRDVGLRITYKLDDGPVESFTASLDEQGTATFQLSAYTKKGRYQFLGFNVDGQSAWFRSAATIKVR